jgi:Mce-associated membrane protein
VITSDAVAEAGGEARRRRPRPVLVVLGVATVLFGGFGAWATVAAHSLRTAAASANGALADRSATSSVEGAVTGAVDVIFSYSYADAGKTRAAAQRLLTGAAIRQYDRLFALVERQAPKEKLVVATKVTNVGVELLSGGRARLLVFADTQDNRAGTSQASYGGAMFAVTAVRRDGRWLIENIDTFTGGT